MAYKDRLEDIRLLFDTGLEKFITHKKYLSARQKYLEIKADFPNRKLDARVNTLLQQGIKMQNKERSPRKEKKKPKKKKKPTEREEWIHTGPRLLFYRYFSETPRVLFFT